MSIRQDKIQLVVEINGKQAGGSLRELKNEARKWQRALDKAQDVDQANEYAANLKKVNDVLADARKKTRGVAASQKEWLTITGKLKAGFLALLPVIGAAFVIDKGRQFFEFISNQVSELDLLRNKYKVVFGDATSIVDGFAEKTAITLGLTEREYKKLASSAGDLLIPMGFQRIEAAKLSTDLVSLSGALSAWTGGQKTSAEVSDILTKALLGEREQLKTLGISIQENDVKQELLIRRQSKLTGEALKQAKALVTLDLITRKSADAQTSFEQKSKGFIQTKARVAARIRDVFQGMAKFFLPVFIKASQVLEKFLNFSIKFVAILASLPKFINENRSALLVLTGAILTLNRGLIVSNSLMLIQKARAIAVSNALRIQTAASRLLNLTLKANPIGLFISLIAALIGGLSVLYIKSESFRTSVINLYKGFTNLIDRASNLPIIGKLIQVAAAPLRLMVDLIGNAGASFQGLKAAVKQAVVNIKLEFLTLSNSAKILALKLDRALSIRKETKDRLSQEIKNLEQLNQVAVESGQSIGEAYTNARNKAIENNRIKDSVSETSNTISTTDITPDKIKIKIDETTNSKSQDDLLKERLSIQKDGFDKELDLLKIQLLKKEVTQEEYESQLINSQRNNFEKQRSIFQEFKQLDSDDFRKAYIEKLEAESEYNEKQIQNKLKVLEDLSENEILQNNRNFVESLITEEQYELQKLENLRASNERKLLLLQELGLQETEAFKEAQSEQVEIQRKTNEEKLAIEQRAATIKNQIQGQVRKGIFDSLNFGIQALSTDEKARKKHASAIKAFEIAKIQVNLASEIQGIWGNTNKSLPPWLATPIAILNTGLAVGRAAVQTAKISKAKFFFGGKTGSKGIYRDNFGDVAGVVHTNEWVAPQWMVDHPVYGSVVNTLEGIRNNKGGFMDGGFTSVDTSPIGLQGVPISQSNDIQGVQELIEKMNEVVESVSKIPKRIKADVVYNEYEAVRQEIGEIQNESSL